MPKKIQIKVGDIVREAELNDSSTAKKIWNVLPITGKVNRWGDEFYFSIPVDAELDDAKDVVEFGDLAYWPKGKALCIFFGKTPMSDGDNIKPASPVDVVGDVWGSLEQYKWIEAGEDICIEKAE